MSASSSIGRTIFQGFFIIIAVMLAFGANTFITEQAQKKAELESLELVLRDLGDSVDELQDFSAYSAGAFDAALVAYGELSGRSPYDRDAVRTALLRVDRNTLQLPMAAYKDMLYSGDLTVVRNRNLRDSIGRFYENVEHRLSVIENNNRVHIDGHLIPALFERGLILPHFAGDTGQAETNMANGAINSQLGAGFSHRRDPLWNFPVDSREWRTLRSTLLAAAQSYAVSENFANDMIVEAQRLEDAIVIYLNERSF
jgi:hypothetical protein